MNKYEYFLAWAKFNFMLDDKRMNFKHNMYEAHKNFSVETISHFSFFIHCVTILVARLFVFAFRAAAEKNRESITKEQKQIIY